MYRVGTILFLFLLLTFSFNLYAKTCKEVNPYLNSNDSLQKQTALALNRILTHQKSHCASSSAQQPTPGQMFVTLVNGKLTEANLKKAVREVLINRVCNRGGSTPIPVSEEPDIEYSMRMINHLFAQKYSTRHDFYKLYHVDEEELREASNYSAKLEILKQGIQGLLRSETGMEKKCIAGICSYCSERGVSCPECDQSSNDLGPAMKLLQDPSQLMLDPANFQCPRT